MCAYEAKIKEQNVVEEKKEEKKEEIVEEKKEEIVEEKKEEIVEDEKEEIVEEKKEEIVEDEKEEIIEEEEDEIVEDEKEEIVEEENEEIVEEEEDEKYDIREEEKYSIKEEEDYDIDMEEDRVVFNNAFTNTRQPNDINVPDPFHPKPLQFKKPIVGRKPRGVSPMLNQTPKIENVEPFPFTIPDFKPIETQASACGIPIIPPQTQQPNDINVPDPFNPKPLQFKKPIVGRKPRGVSPMLNQTPKIENVEPFPFTIPDFKPIETQASACGIPIIPPQTQQPYNMVTGIEYDNESVSSGYSNGIKKIAFREIYNYLPSIGGKVTKKMFGDHLPTNEETERNTECHNGWYYDPEYLRPSSHGKIFDIIKY